MKVTDHICNRANEHIQINVMDPPGNGGAHHYYAVDVGGTEHGMDVRFQDGPVIENGVNGITQETLIAIAIHRLRCFQAGPFACRENAIALTKLEEAMHWLHARTRARMARNVEGKSVA